MITVWEAFLLGTVQGVTEFLPISSSGHLVMAQEVLGVSVPGVLFEVWVHMATLLSIVLIYRQRIAGLLGGILNRDQKALEYLGLLVLATLPAVAVGLLGEELVKVMFENPVIPGLALLVTGGFLWTTRSVAVAIKGEYPKWTGALLIGLAQALALIPGISRSGTTVVAGLWLGLKAEDAAEFSFLMAIPVILGATLLELSEIGASPSLPTATLFVAGMASALTGVLAIQTFIKSLHKGSFHLFGLYCWIVGFGFLFYLWIK